MALVRTLCALAVALLLNACAPVTTSANTGAKEGGAMSDPVVISLARSGCYGFCPVYTVRITGEGDVTYVGQRFVNVVGEQHASVPREAVRALVARFDAAGFEGLRDSYEARVTDLPTYTLSLERDGRRKTVSDYGGLSAGMPEAVRALQQEVDRVAGTERWVLRNGEPVRTAPEP